MTIEVLEDVILHISIFAGFLKTRGDFHSMYKYLNEYFICDKTGRVRDHVLLQDVYREGRDYFNGVHGKCYEDKYLRGSR